MTAFTAIQVLAVAATDAAAPVPPATENIAQTVATNAALITPQTFAVLLVVWIAAVTLFALALIYRHVKDAGTTWSLADALSEEATVGPAIKNKADELVLDKEGNVQYANEMRASSSRLIALLCIERLDPGRNKGLHHLFPLWNGAVRALSRQQILQYLQLAEVKA